MLADLVVESFQPGGVGVGPGLEVGGARRVDRGEGRSDVLHHELGVAGVEPDVRVDVGGLSGVRAASRDRDGFVRSEELQTAGGLHDLEVLSPRALDHVGDPLLEAGTVDDQQVGLSQELGLRRSEAGLVRRSAGRQQILETDRVARHVGHEGVEGRRGGDHQGFARVGAAPEPPPCWPHPQ